MKKVIRTFCVMSLVTLALVGCNGSSEGDAKKVAEEFITNIYTVDAKKVAEFKSLDEHVQIPPEMSIIGKDVPEVTIIPPTKEFTEIIKSLDKNIQPLMTKGAYEELVANVFNLKITFMCVDGNYTSQLTDLTLGENVYKDYEDKNTVRYSYVTKLKFITTDEKAEKIGTSKGGIELIKENGQWKVQGFGINDIRQIITEQ